MNSPEDSLSEIAVAEARTAMFRSLCALLDANQIAYAILSGYDEYPVQFPSDIDFMVSASDFARLPELLAQPGAIPNATLVQALQHQTTSCYFAFVRQVGTRCAFLHPDAASDYRLSSRLWMRYERVLDTRRWSSKGFWVTAADVEFEYYLIKRVVGKAHLSEAHVSRLYRCWTEDPARCAAVLERLFSGEDALNLQAALRRTDAAWFETNMGALRRKLLLTAPREPLLSRWKHAAGELTRWLKRAWQPTGLVMVVLGPDGSGKTTVIEHLASQIAPAFCRVRRFHLRPYFGKVGKAVPPVTTPHAQAPRSTLASLAKLGLFVLDYQVSWLKLILPARARSTFVIFDRYFHDMAVDSRRYRLPPKFWAVGFFAPLIPKPDCWLVLAARPDQLLTRKNELSSQAAIELTLAYQTLAQRTRGASLLDTSGSLDTTLCTANALMIEQLHKRCLMRLGLQHR
jgi:thymidylate kinase